MKVGIPFEHMPAELPISLRPSTWSQLPVLNGATTQSEPQRGGSSLTIPELVQVITLRPRCHATLSGHEGAQIAYAPRVYLPQL